MGLDVGVESREGGGGGGDDAVLSAPPKTSPIGKIDWVTSRVCVAGPKLAETVSNSAKKLFQENSSSGDCSSWTARLLLATGLSSLEVSVPFSCRRLSELLPRLAGVEGLLESGGELQVFTPAPVFSESSGGGGGGFLWTEDVNLPLPLTVSKVPG